MIYIFGTGVGSHIIKNALKGGIHFDGYIDNNKDKQEQLIDDTKVYGLENVDTKSSVIISVMSPVARINIYNQLIEYGFPKRKIIIFYSLECCLQKAAWQLIDMKKWVVEICRFYIGKHFRQYIKKYNIKKYGEEQGHLRNIIDSFKKNGAEGKSIVVIGHDSLSVYFHDELKKVIPEDVWGLTVYDKKVVGSCTGITVSFRDFDDLLYEDVEQLVFYILDRAQAYKIQGALIVDMQVPKENIKMVFSETGAMVRDTYDVQLGYTRISDMPGFVVFKDNESKETSYRIVTLGGSTTDPTYNNQKSWSELLYEQLSKYDKNIEVICGGICSYTCTQELYKMIRDVLELEPDLVISYSAINDFLESYFVKEHPYILQYQMDIIKKNVDEGRMNDTLAEINVPITKVTCGIKSKKSIAEHWIDCERMMYAICKEYGIDFLAFLQPYFLEGNIFLNQEQLNAVKKNYDEVKREMETTKREWLIDFTHIFEGKENVYFDLCHVYEQGNRIIVKNMMPYILTMIKEAGQRKEIR